MCDLCRFAYTYHTTTATDVANRDSHGQRRRSLQSGACRRARELAMHLDADRILMKISRTDQPLATWVDELNENPSDPVATTVFLTLGTGFSAKAHVSKKKIKRRCFAHGRHMIEILLL